MELLYEMLRIHWKQDILKHINKWLPFWNMLLIGFEDEPVPAALMRCNVVVSAEMGDGWNAIQLRVDKPSFSSINCGNWEYSNKFKVGKGAVIESISTIACNRRVITYQLYQDRWTRSRWVVVVGWRGRCDCVKGVRCIDNPNRDKWHDFLR